MSEEKKEEAQKPAAEAAQKPVEQAAPKTAEPKVEAKPQAAAEPKTDETKKKEVKAEKPDTCASCNKSIKNKRWYYRNGKYYCSKRCWQTAFKKEKAPAAEAAPQ